MYKSGLCHGRRENQPRVYKTCFKQNPASTPMPTTTLVHDLHDGKNTQKISDNTNIDVPDS